MTGTGTIHSHQIRDCTFLTQEQFDKIEKREFQIPPTGRRIGRTWLTLFRRKENGEKVWVHCEWIVEPGWVPIYPNRSNSPTEFHQDAVKCDISHLCVIEWEK